MFACFTFVSSVINLIYSKQLFLLQIIVRSFVNANPVMFAQVEVKMKKNGDFLIY